MRIQDMLMPQGTKGFGQALQAASPLLLAMGQGLSQGKGVNAYMPQGLAGMMALGEQREQEAKAQALSEAAKNAGMSPTEQALFESMDLGGKQSFLSQLMAERRARANRVGRAPSEAERASSYLASLGASTGAAQPQGGGGLSMGMPASASAPVASAGGLSFGSAVDAGQQPPGMPLGTSISSAMAPQAPSGGLTPQTLGFSPGIAERAQAAPSGPPAGRSADELMRLRGTLQQRLMAVTQAAMSGNPDALAAQGVLAKQLQVVDSMMPQQEEGTTLRQNVEWIMSQNPGMGFQDALAMARSGQTINVNAGSVPGAEPLGTEGQILVPDANAPGGYRVELAEGSKAWLAQQEAARAAAEGKRSKGVSADIVLDEIDIAKQLIQGESAMSPATGVIGKAASALDSSRAGALKNRLTTIKSNIGFDKLQAMRDASPTGGALGQVSEFENRLLQSVFGSLEQSQSPQDILYNLSRLEELYGRIVNEGIPRDEARELYRQEALRDVKSGNPGIPEPGTTEDGYRFKGGDPSDPANWEKL